VSLDGLLRGVVEVLHECRIPFMITGSIASAYYAVPRATQDADLVVDPGPDQLKLLVERLQRRGFYFSESAAQEALLVRGQFNAIDASNGWKADLIIRKDRPFSLQEFSRRRSATVLGVEVSLATHEDLILAKLEWAAMGDSSLQERDVLQLLEAGWETLDMEYIAEWARELGVDAAWERAIERVKASRDDNAG
jgi:hypothetical protein